MPAFGRSILLHGAAVALLVLAAYVANPSRPPEPKIFDVVAGVGNNYLATEAPKLGEENGNPQIKLNLPATAAPEVPPPSAPATPAETAPPQPAEATPVVPMQAPAVPVRRAPAAHRPAVHHAPSAKAASAATVPNFVHELNRARIRHQWHLQWLQRVAAARARKAEEQALRAAAAARRMSYSQYLKEHGSAFGSAAAAPKGVHGGVARGTGSAPGAGGHALTRAQMDEMDAYFAELRAQLLNDFAAPPDATEKMLAHVAFYLAADGSISNARITHSSGDPAFDQAVLDAFHRVSMPPRPDHQGEEDELDFSLSEEMGQQAGP